MLRSRHRAARRRLALECLEQRQLLSASLWGVRWLIWGDEGGWQDDAITVTASPDGATLTATINDVEVGTAPAAQVRFIGVFAGGGDDTVDVALSARQAPGAVAPPRAFVWGGPGDDYLRTGDGDDLIVDWLGNNTLIGNAGNDWLFAGIGDDTLDGGAGRDVLVGTWGADWFYADPDDWLLRQADDVVVTTSDVAAPPPAASDDALHRWLMDSAVEQWSHMLGRVVRGDIWPEDLPIGFHAGLEQNASDTGSAADHSSTNVQELGVDEADLVETDGEYLYTLAGSDLLVIDAWPAEDMHMVARVPLDGPAQGIYLNGAGDTVTVISLQYGGLPDDWPDPIILADAAQGFAPLPGKSQVQVSTFDVSDPTAPELTREMFLDGSLVATRVVDDALYAVVRNRLHFPLPLYHTPGDGTRVYETEAEYRRRLTEDSWVDSELPGFGTLSYAGDEVTQHAGPLSLPAAFLLPPEPYGRDLLTIAVLDVPGRADEPLGSTTVAGTNGQVYASAENLYIVGSPWHSWWALDSGQTSRIMKFGLEGDAVPLLATGAVPGWALDQFSLSEHNGMLRIATTTGFGDARSNALYVLEQHGPKLLPVGRLEGLAPTESIQSVRFIGERAYVVTFRVVDPLFTIDLGDPTAPRVAGELKIPGFSSYLHPVGSDHLIGFGRDADPGTGRARGLQASLFDVSDMANPTRTDVLTLSEADWSHSGALWEHHAFSYFPDSGIMAVPVSHHDWGPDSGIMAVPVSHHDWGQGDTNTLEVVRVNTDTGFESLGNIEHETSVLRSLRIGEFLYSVSLSTVKVHTLTDPAEQIAEMPL